MSGNGDYLPSLSILSMRSRVSCRSVERYIDVSTTLGLNCLLSLTICPPFTTLSTLLVVFVDASSLEMVSYRFLLSSIDFTSLKRLTMLIFSSLVVEFSVMIFTILPRL